MEPVTRTSRPLLQRPAPRTTAVAKSDSPPDSDSIAEQEAIAKQHQAFDFAMAQRAELLREADARRDMMLAQLKSDEEALKKYIAMI